MKKVLLIFLFSVSFTLVAQRQFTPDYLRYDKEDSFLEVAPAYYMRDTILADGRISHINRAQGPCYGLNKDHDNTWCYVRLPNGVKLLVGCLSEFHYPTNMEPGLYNLIPDLVKVVGTNEDGDPIVETKHYYASWEEQETKPEPKEEPEPETTLNSSPCSIQVGGKTIPLYGRVQVVSSFGDIKVAESSFPDLRVKSVSVATKCGEWQFVDSNPDFTIEYSSYPDLRIEFSSFPGIP
jgi:hypothetical protein